MVLFRSLYFSIRITAAPSRRLTSILPFLIETNQYPLCFAWVRAFQKSMWSFFVKFSLKKTLSLISAIYFWIHWLRLRLSLNLTRVGGTFPSVAPNRCTASMSQTVGPVNSGFSAKLFTTSNRSSFSCFWTPWISTFHRPEYCSKTSVIALRSTTSSFSLTLCSSSCVLLSRSISLYLLPSTFFKISLYFSESIAIAV